MNAAFVVHQDFDIHAVERCRRVRAGPVWGMMSFNWAFTGVSAYRECSSVQAGDLGRGVVDDGVDEALQLQVEALSAK